MGKTAVLTRSLPFAALCLALACSNPSGDQPAQVTPNPLGSGLRVRQVVDPTSPNHPTDHEPNGPHPDVYITGASLIWTDNYDETMDGKSIGTVYLEDVGSSAPYSGLGVYEPAYVPADLRVAPGDVLDFTGPFEELINVGTATFTPPQVLPQMDKPQSVFRYEYQVPTPTMVNVTDLNDYKTGYQWENMLVTVQNVTLFALSADTAGRVTGPISSDTSQNGVAVSNELMPINAGNPLKGIPGDYAPGTKFSSVTGIVTWFFSYHIAPRTKADLVVAQ